MNKKVAIIQLCLALALSVSGFVIMVSENWKIAVGVMLVLWANNISNKFNQR